MCRSCVSRAFKARGACPGCGKERLLVGHDSDGRPVCVGCAGITTCFTCASCGHEGQQWYAGTCLACSLRRRLADILDDGNGRVAPALVPLHEKLSSVPNPISGLTWLNKPAVRARLRALANGSVPLTHEGVGSMDGPQGREFLRELLTSVGLLPGRDKYLAAFERWRARRLESVTDPAARQEVALYIAWWHLKNLRVRSEAGRLRAEDTNLARDQTDAAVRFLGFLSERGLTLAQVAQADLDAWFASTPNGPLAANFLTFATRSRRCPRLKLPAQRARSSPGSPLVRLRELVGHLCADESLALADRVAGLIVVLFAQPLTRVARLGLGDVVEDSEQMALLLGPDPAPVPEPLAVLLSRYRGERTNMGTTNTATSFLFPGGRPGQHMTAAQLGHRLRRIGVTRTERLGRSPTLSTRPRRRSSPRSLATPTPLPPLGRHRTGRTGRTT